MITALELVEQEEQRRDQLVAQVREVVAHYYVTGGARDVFTRRSDVHQLVAMEMGFEAMRGQLISLVNAIVTGMGGVPASIGNRPVFLAMRRHDVDPRDARRRALEDKRRWRARKDHDRPRKAKKLTAAEVAEWARRLEAEGLGEVLPLPRRAAGGATREGRGMAVIDGVHRQRTTTQAEIYAGAEERWTSMLGELETEVAVLRLRAQGLALRPIAIKTGLQKDMVAAILKRIEARHQP